MLNITVYDSTEASHSRWGNRMHKVAINNIILPVAVELLSFYAAVERIIIPVSCNQEAVSATLPFRIGNMLLPEIKGAYIKKDPDKIVCKPLHQCQQWILMQKPILNNRGTVSSDQLIQFFLEQPTP